MSNGFGWSLEGERVRQTPEIDVCIVFAYVRLPTLSPAPCVLAFFITYSCKALQYCTSISTPLLSRSTLCRAFGLIKAVLIHIYVLDFALLYGEVNENVTADA